MENGDSIFNTNLWISTAAITALYFMAIYAKHEILISDDILLSEFKGDDFDKYLEVMVGFRLVKYFFLILFFILSIIIMFVLVYFANSMFHFNLPSNFIFNTALLTCSVEIVKEISIFIWFETQSSFVSSQVFNFYPLSLFSALGGNDTSFPLSYILQSLDFFFCVKVYCNYIMSGVSKSTSCRGNYKSGLVYLRASHVSVLCTDLFCPVISWREGYDFND